MDFQTIVIFINSKFFFKLFKSFRLHFTSKFIYFCFFSNILKNTCTKRSIISNINVLKHQISHTKIFKQEMCMHAQQLLRNFLFDEIKKNFFFLIYQRKGKTFFCLLWKSFIGFLSFWRWAMYKQKPVWRKRQRKLDFIPSEWVLLNMEVNVERFVWKIRKF